MAKVQTPLNLRSAAKFWPGSYRRSSKRAPHAERRRLGRNTSSTHRTHDGVAASRKHVRRHRMPNCRCRPHRPQAARSHGRGGRRAVAADSRHARPSRTRVAVHQVNLARTPLRGAKSNPSADGPNSQPQGLRTRERKPTPTPIPTWKRGSSHTPAMRQ